MERALRSAEKEKITRQNYSRYNNEKNHLQFAKVLGVKFRYSIIIIGFMCLMHIWEEVYAC